MTTTKSSRTKKKSGVPRRVSEECVARAGESETATEHGHAGDVWNDTESSSANGECHAVTDDGGANSNGVGHLDIERKRANGEGVHATESTSANGNGKGDTPCVTETACAPEERQGDECVRANDSFTDSLCRSLQSLERQRRFALKQCIRGENAITAFVAWNVCGFHTGIPTEAEREKLWKKAGKLVKEIDSGDLRSDSEKGIATEDDSSPDTDKDSVSNDLPSDSDGDSVAGEGWLDTESPRVQDDSGGDFSPNTEKGSASADDSGGDSRVATEHARAAGVVRVSKISRKAWADYEKGLMDEMMRLAGQLPVAPWLSEPETRGISLGMLATIVGESGNLSNYPNPAKLWKRLFGAPIEKNGKTMMPSRWRLEKGLSSEEWEEAGYSPQRHATMQQLKENIVMQNGEGPYRKRYDEAKQRTRGTHPEWWVCGKCDGKGKVERKKCQNCKGTGEIALHPHRHAQLLAAKRFVRDLWNRWHGIDLDSEKIDVPRVLQ